MMTDPTPEVNRAFSASAFSSSVPWGVAPGWYGRALLALSRFTFGNSRSPDRSQKSSVSWSPADLVDIPRAHVNHQAMRRGLLLAVIYNFALLLTADAQQGPKNSVLLIIRHAENPANGHGLSPRGEQRAKAYANYFQ